MKIRSQFIALVVSLVLVPVLLAGIGISLWALTKSEFEIPRYEELSPSARSSTDRQTWDSLRSRYGTLPKGNDYYLFTQDFRQLYSSVPDSPFVSDRPVSSDQLLTILRMEGVTRDVGLINIPESKLWLAIVIKRDEFNWGEAIVFGSGIALGVMVVILIVAAILMARSWTKAIVRLEKSVRLVRDGDLDTTVDGVRGNDEIESLGRSFDQLRLTLKEDGARKSRFVMGVSHDLKTPLALVRGYVELLRDGTVARPEDTEAHFDLILAKVEQLDDMIDHLIEYSKVDTGEWQQTWVPFSLLSFLEEFAASMFPVARILGQNLVTDLDVPGDLEVRGDLRSVRRCFENLVNNALRYNRAGGTVGLRAEPGPGCILVTVWDDGPGIAAQDLPHLFEMFYRGTQARREQGMGLGLSIVKTILDSHGWTIRAESAGGARFIVRIPTGPDQASGAVTASGKSRGRAKP